MSYECEDSDIENYADDTAPYTCASDINKVISELQKQSVNPLHGLTTITWKWTLKKATFF